LEKHSIVVPGRLSWYPVTWAEPPRALLSLFSSPLGTTKTGQNPCLNGPCHENFLVGIGFWMDMLQGFCQVKARYKKLNGNHSPNVNIRDFKAQEESIMPE
jgi:hypothetical protein